MLPQLSRDPIPDHGLDSKKLKSTNEGLDIVVGKCLNLIVHEDSINRVRIADAQLLLARLPNLV